MLLILALFAASQVPQALTAITNVNVIPMDSERVLTDQTVIIRNGLIADIGKDLKVPFQAKVISGKGKFLIPGLIDMHAHLLSDGEEYPKTIAEDELRIMIANGVTTVRFMIGTKEQLALREKSRRGEIIGPTIFAASPHLTGRKQENDYLVKTEAEARDAVHKSNADGFDFIKITTSIDPAVYEAAVEEASKQKIRVVGHADSRFVGLARAFKAKQQIEHLDGYMEALLVDHAPMKGSVSDAYIYNVKNWDSLDFIDETKIGDLAKQTVAANPFCTPTQHFMKYTFGRPRSEESIRRQPDFRFYPMKNQDFYLNYIKRTPLNQVPQAKKDKWIRIREQIILAIHNAGGKIMAGSDSPEFLFLYGYSLHRELKALKEAGLSNFAALQAATTNPAEFLRTSAQSGTLEKGKRADMVLLEANPLDEISNTTRQAGVFLRGEFYSQKELSKWLDEIAPRLHGALDKPTELPN